MKKSALTFAFVSLFVPAFAQASSWSLDLPHSSIGFSVRHAMLSNVHGAFTKAAGTITVDDKDITKSHGEVIIDVDSVDTRSEQRDTHLKGPDFFDAKQFPKITFTSTKIVNAGKQIKVHGNLSMHGMTKPIVLTGNAPSKAVKDPFGMVRSGMTLSGKINRKDYNLTWNKALEAGGFLVGEEVSLTIEAEFVRHDSTENNPAAKEGPAGKVTPTPSAK